MAVDEVNVTLQNKEESIKKKAEKLIFKLCVKYHINAQKHRKVIFWKILNHAINSYKI